MNTCLSCGRPITLRARLRRLLWAPLWCGIPFRTFTAGSSIIVYHTCSWRCADAFVRRPRPNDPNRLLRQRWEAARR